MDWLDRYRMRLRRRRRLWEAIRARHGLTLVADRRALLAGNGVPVFACLRNEIDRLAPWLAHYRALGAGPFLIVDNASDDGTAQALADQPDVILWHAPGSYRAARFGMTWLGWLLLRHGHGRWCLTVDADELLVYDGCDRHDLRELTAALDRVGQPVLGALMLDLYPRGPLGTADGPVERPAEALPWIDATGYRQRRHWPMRNLHVQGGPRDRAFFAHAPERAPTLNKLPLVRWNRRFAYINSTHAALPPRLNLGYDFRDGTGPSGVLLHTKFLPGITARARVEKARGEHFGDGAAFAGYYDALASAPTLWHDGSMRYAGPRQLLDLGLMRPVDWERGASG